MIRILTTDKHGYKERKPNIGHQSSVTPIVYPASSATLINLVLYENQVLTIDNNPSLSVRLGGKLLFWKAFIKIHG